MSDISYYSPEGLKKLKDELDHLELVERPRVTQEYLMLGIRET